MNKRTNKRTNERTNEQNLHEKELMQMEMKEMKEQQQTKSEEAEIQRKRRSYADDGGFCFKATSISIKYIKE